jgi:hypothetical protein
MSHLLRLWTRIWGPSDPLRVKPGEPRSFSGMYMHTSVGALYNIPGPEGHMMYRVVCEMTWLIRKSTHFIEEKPNKSSMQMFLFPRTSLARSPL